ncbi:unnamed protein product [Rotaria socialis]|uniref:Uncharacterized protein n=1 Tax=Rotaria socialis TaxID=392032 RepID=A0A818C319_9BILA|nr:unnamed protein product [Rotaria socialis]CAF4535861.1 unnamed protein product [Rotaria socialis]
MSIYIRIRTRTRRLIEYSSIKQALYAFEELQTEARVKTVAFIMQRDFNHNDGNNEILRTSITDCNSSKAICSSTRPSKDRDFIKYSTKRLSRSKTPPNLHSVVADRKRRCADKEEIGTSRNDLNFRRDGRRSNHQGHHKTESRSLSFDNRSSIIIKHGRNIASSSSHKIYSSSSSSSSSSVAAAKITTTSNHEHQKKDSRPYRSHHRVVTGLAPVSSHDRYIYRPIGSTPKIGEIYIIRQSIDKLFGLVARRSKSYEDLDDSKSSSVSLSSTETKNERPKPRPCLVWNDNPIEVLLMTTFDRADVTDPNFEYGPFSIDYIRRHLLCIHPRKEFDDRRSIKSNAKHNRALTIQDEYLILIPVLIDKDTEFRKLVPEYFDQDDLDYINTIIFDLSLERKQRQTATIRKINFDVLLKNNKDGDNDDSLPTTRSYVLDKYMSSPLSPLEKINMVENKSFTPEISLIGSNSDHDHDDDEQMIFILNETGEPLSIQNLIGFKIPTSSTPVNIIQHEYVLLIASNENQLDAGLSTNQIEDSQKKQKIDFKIENRIITMNLNGICKRVFDIALSSDSHWPIQILCDTQIHNDQLCLTLSSIVKINNNTTSGLLILNLDRMDARQSRTIAKIGADDEYYVPIASLYKDSSQTICIGIDENENEDVFSFDWVQDFPQERKLKLKNGNELCFIIYKESSEAYLENTNRLDRTTFTFSIHLMQRI